MFSIIPANSAQGVSPTQKANILGLWK